MATIDDFGGPGEALGQPALGGPSGWAAAVRDYITGLPAQVAANTSAIAGKVAKAGDTMTGALVIEQAGTTAAQALLKVKAGPTGPTGTLRYVSPTSGFIFDIDGGTGTPSERPVVGVGDPTASTHAATKGYVDTPRGIGLATVTDSVSPGTTGFKACGLLSSRISDPTSHGIAWGTGNAVITPTAAGQMFLVTYNTFAGVNMIVQNRVVSSGGSVAANTFTDEGTSIGANACGASCTMAIFSPTAEAFTVSFALAHNSGSAQSLKSEVSIMRIGG